MRRFQAFRIARLGGVLRFVLLILAIGSMTRPHVQFAGQAGETDRAAMQGAGHEAPPDGEAAATTMPALACVMGCTGSSSDLAFSPSATDADFGTLATAFALPQTRDQARMEPAERPPRIVFWL